MINDFEPMNVEKLETVVGGVMTGKGLAKAIGAGAASYAVTHY